LIKKINLFKIIFCFKNIYPLIFQNFRKSKIHKENYKDLNKFNSIININKQIINIENCLKNKEKSIIIKC